MTGYVRADTSNNIANGKVIDATDLDNEFDAVQEAFSNTTGHSHDGSPSEGSPITVLGPVQDFVATATSFSPKTDSTYSLGTVTEKWSTLFADTIEGAVIGGTTPAEATFTNVTATTFTGSSFVGALTGNSDTASTLETSRTISLSGDASGSVSFNGSSDVSIPVVVGNDSHSHTLSTITDAGTIASQDANSVTISGGSIYGISDLAVQDGGTGASDATSARQNLNAQERNLNLDSLSGLILSADKGLYSTGPNTLTTFDLTNRARSLLAASDQSQQILALGFGDGVTLDVETTLTDDDTKLATSGGVFDALANYLTTTVNGTDFVVKFPGFTFQSFVIDVTTDTPQSFSFPEPFGTACLGVIASSRTRGAGYGDTNIGVPFSLEATSNSQFIVDRDSDIGGSLNLQIFAVGY